MSTYRVVHELIRKGCGFASLPTSLEDKLAGQINFLVNSWARAHKSYYKSIITYRFPILTERPTATFAVTNATTLILTITSSELPTLLDMVGATLIDETGNRNFTIAASGTEGGPYTVTLLHPHRFKIGEEITIYSRAINTQPSDLIDVDIEAFYSDDPPYNMWTLRFVPWSQFIKQQFLVDTPYDSDRPICFTYEPTANIFIASHARSLEPVYTFTIRYYYSPELATDNFDKLSIILPDSVLTDLQVTMIEWLKKEQGRPNEYARFEQRMLSNGNFKPF